MKDVRVQKQSIMLDSAVKVKAVSRQKPAQFWILVATIIGSSIAFIDGTVVNVALPAIQTSLGASVSHMQWVVEAYGLFLASLILVGGSMGDAFGRRRVYGIGITLFAIASLFCGWSTNAAQLITARAVQGIGGAMLVPGSLAIITASFSPEDRGRAIGTWSASAAVMTALGPVVGGWIVENASWRWVFYINIPLAIVTLIILLWQVPESRNEKSRGLLDWKGAILATLGLGGLVFGLIESSNLGIANPLVWGAFFIGIICLTTFAWVEIRSDAPLLPLGLFRSKTFSGANLITLLLYGAMYGVLFFMPFNLIQVRNYGEFAAGAAFLPAILSVAIISRWSGELMGRIGARPLLFGGALLAAIGYALFAIMGVKDGNYAVTLLPGMLAMGLGMGICVAPLTTAVMSSVHIGYSGLASGLNNAISYTAALLSIAILGIVILFVFNHQLDERLAIAQVPSAIVEELQVERTKLAAAKIPADVTPQVAAQLTEAIHGSFLDGFRLIMWIATGMAIVAAVTVLFTIDESAMDFSVETEHVGFG